MPERDGDEIRFDRLGPELLRRFPDCEAIARENFVDLEDPEAAGAYTIFGGVVHPYLERLIAFNHLDDVRSVMDFIELLARQRDQYWPELVRIEFGERVYGYAHKSILQGLAGSETKKAIWNAERYFVRCQRQNESSPFTDFFRRLFLPKRKG